MCETGSAASASPKKTSASAPLKSTARRLRRYAALAERQRLTSTTIASRRTTTAATSMKTVTRSLSSGWSLTNSSLAGHLSQGGDSPSCTTCTSVGAASTIT